MTSYPPPARFKMSDFNIGNFMFQPWIFRGCLSFQGCSWLMTGSLWRFTLCIYNSRINGVLFFRTPYITSDNQTQRPQGNCCCSTNLTWSSHTLNIQTINGPSTKTQGVEGKLYHQTSTKAVSWHPLSWKRGEPQKEKFTFHYSGCLL